MDRVDGSDMINSENKMETKQRRKEKRRQDQKEMIKNIDGKDETKRKGDEERETKGKRNKN